jgi:hypothetical protein
VLESVEAALGGIAVSVGVGIEAWWSPAAWAFGFAVRDWSRRSGMVCAIFAVRSQARVEGCE